MFRVSTTLIIMYSLLRPVLFQLPAETAHQLSLSALDLMAPINRMIYGKVNAKPVELMGLRFPSAVGLAAGLDKNAAHIDGLAALGFGFLEVGTVTPRPQPGNPKPRLFRIPEAQAIINRMGFNNDGVDQLIHNVKASSYQGVLGINIGKNFDTPVELAQDDYVLAMEKVYVHADYITVNISSPNTPGLRDLQHGEALQTLLMALKAKQQELSELHGKYVPVLVKVAPDLTDADIADMSERFLAADIDGVIATNTTFSRAAVEGLNHANEQGGLSGAPLTASSTDVLEKFYAHLGEDIPLIAAGGIMSANDAIKKLQAGAKLVQIYSGLMYKGPKLIKEINQEIMNHA